ncbi:glycoside hydrolase N-terminal domain-containing protein [Prevotella sp. S7 MS 2]|uniref:glycoside hydrolase family 95 protein n=1 Tax=Prevotella sp. S7 MS 2 TaxID=1287488 RepID=UPI000513F661|nr:glycoside hydrolase family 95 protein [Prevotella sp. S7 MS 2]KGI60033.1 glycoside hydrolase family 95 [Prevotella sp. S7 MS 2]
MKKSSLILGAVLLLSSTTIRAQLSNLVVWFDTPSTLNGRTAWYGGHPDMWSQENKPTTAGDGIHNPDQEWESRSLPIGNGNLGANIMGSVSAERFTLNEKSLWRGGPNVKQGPAYYWNVNKQSAHVLKDIRDAFTRGDQKTAEELTAKNFNGLAAYSANEEEDFRFGNFTTMGECYIETGLSEVGMTHYRRELSLDSALAKVSFTKDGTHYQRTSFISYPANIMVVKLKADKPGMQNLLFSYAPNPVATGHIQADGTDGVVYQAALDNNGMRFTVRIKAVAKGGKVSVTDGKIRVNGADEVTFYIAGDTDYQMNFDPDFTNRKAYVGVDPDATTQQWMQAAIAKGYDELLREHAADYMPLFNRVQLTLNPDKAVNLLPTNLRLQNYRKGKADFGLEELYYQFGRYLLIASSRPGTLPANLQGIWHNNVDGPWRVDYHNNINIQMNYWPSLQANLAECAQPLTDFIKTQAKPGAVTAKAYYNARGWTSSISANIFGFTAPLSDEQMQWNLCPMAGPWLATHLWEYYDFTRDKNFLRTTGYPLMKGSADFAVDYLWKRADGVYTAAPSTSPEHGPVDQGATFSHAVIREILTDAIAASKVLGVDAKARQEWENALRHLAPYRIGRYGQIMEWSTDIDDPDDHHRHVNHLFGLHPGHTISPITTPELAKAAKVVLKHRGDGATGWSMGWKLNQWARLHDGNHAYTLYRNLLKNGTLDNLWDTHAPFQIDGNFGGTAGITEMLLQSQMGFIHLLPALPDAWSTGSVSGLMARGNFEVGLNWTNGLLSEATIKAKSGGKCTLRYGSHTLSLNTRAGKTYTLAYDKEKGLKVK